VYHSLACTFNSNGKFGRGLKNCKLAFKCLEASQIFSVESDVKKGNDLGLYTMTMFSAFDKNSQNMENGVLFTFILALIDTKKNTTSIVPN